MVVRRCDRCKTEIIEKSGIVEAIAEVMKPYPRINIEIDKDPVFGTWETVDLCPECEKDFQKWLNNEK